MLELALHLEKSVINLKMDALWLWNIALASTACGNLLNLIENAYGYPTSKASIERGSYLETVKREFAENVSDVELASGIMTKEADVTEMHGEAPHQKEGRKVPKVRISANWPKLFPWLPPPPWDFTRLE